MPDRWTADRIPEQSGRTALVTGGNSGLGLEASKVLAAAGARVVIGCRDLGKGETARAEIATVAPGAEVELLELDLADLGSVERAAAELGHGNRRLDLLINNAGVMATPERRTADGFELQLGTNHLGHFALTGRLLESLRRARKPRVVTVSSNAHMRGRIDFDDLMWRSRRYSSWGAYASSKLANLMFGYELDRRLRAAGERLISLAAHPGYSATNLQSTGVGMGSNPIPELAMKLTNALVAQSAEMGALPILYAASEPGLVGGEYVGPDGFMQGRGHPKIVEPAGRARKSADWRRLWEASEQLTGVSFPGLSA